MSYQSERDQFIAQMTREGLPIWATQALLRAATGFNRRAELACSSEAADRDRVKCPRAVAEKKYSTKSIAVATRAFEKYPCLCDNFDHETGQHGNITRITLQDYRAEQRLIKMLAEHNVKAGHYKGNETQRGLWELLTAGDPRGYTLRVIPPSYHERNQGKDRHNLDSIGVPARESRIKW